MGLSGIDTGRLSTFSAEVAGDPALMAIRDKVELEFRTGIPNTFAEIELLLTNGTRLTARHDSGLPASDTEAQGRRLQQKFMGLVEPILGTARATALMEEIGRFEALPNVTGVMSMCAGN